MSTCSTIQCKKLLQTPCDPEDTVRWEVRDTRGKKRAEVNRQLCANHLSIWLDCLLEQFDAFDLAAYSIKTKKIIQRYADGEDNDFHVQWMELSFVEEGLDFETVLVADAPEDGWRYPCLQDEKQDICDQDQIVKIVADRIRKSDAESIRVELVLQLTKVPQLPKAQFTYGWVPRDNDGRRANPRSPKEIGQILSCSHLNWALNSESNRIQTSISLTRIEEEEEEPEPTPAPPPLKRKTSRTLSRKPSRAPAKEEEKKPPPFEFQGLPKPSNVVPKILVVETIPGEEDEFKLKEVSAEVQEAEEDDLRYWQQHFQASRTIALLQEKYETQWLSIINALDQTDMNDIACYVVLKHPLLLRMLTEGNASKVSAEKVQAALEAIAHTNEADCSAVTGKITEVEAKIQAAVRICGLTDGNPNINIQQISIMTLKQRYELRRQLMKQGCIDLPEVAKRISVEFDNIIFDLETFMHERLGFGKHLESEAEVQAARERSQWFGKRVFKKVASGISTVLGGLKVAIKRVWRGIVNAGEVHLFRIVTIWYPAGVAVIAAAQQVAQEAGSGTLSMGTIGRVLSTIFCELASSTGAAYALMQAAWTYGKIYLGIGDVLGEDLPEDVKQKREAFERQFGQTKLVKWILKHKSILQTPVPEAAATDVKETLKTGEKELDRIVSSEELAGHMARDVAASYKATIHEAVQQATSEAGLERGLSITKYLGLTLGTIAGFGPVTQFIGQLAVCQGLSAARLIASIFNPYEFYAEVASSMRAILQKFISCKFTFRSALKGGRYLLPTSVIVPAPVAEKALQQKGAGAGLGFLAGGTLGAGLFLLTAPVSLPGVLAVGAVAGTATILGAVGGAAIVGTAHEAAAGQHCDIWNFVIALAGIIVTVIAVKKLMGIGKKRQNRPRQIKRPPPASRLAVGKPLLPHWRL